MTLRVRPVVIRGTAVADPRSWHAAVYVARCREIHGRPIAIPATGRAQAVDEAAFWYERINEDILAVADAVKRRDRMWAFRTARISPLSRVAVGPRQRNDHLASISARGQQTFRVHKKMPTPDRGDGDDHVSAGRAGGHEFPTLVVGIKKRHCLRERAATGRARRNQFVLDVIDG